LERLTLAVRCAGIVPALNTGKVRSNMTSRRSFLVSTGLTAALARSAAGANERIRVGAIGTGVRGSYLAPVFASNPDCEVVAVCDVFKPHRDQTTAALPAPADSVVDYRRILERKDVDAVLIATPDHWHAPMIIESTQAGKDVYCEKPLSNNIDAATRAVEAVRTSGRVVQIGLQQRSWEHFQKCQPWVQGGRFGTIYHAQMQWQGHYSQAPETPTDPPADLDWELFQGPAARKPYSAGRQHSWRGYYDYGGGIITDQGVHLCDLVRWYLDAGQPLSVAASARWVRVAPPNPEQPPDTFAITWRYDKFVMSFANTLMPSTDIFADHGVFFFGTVGSLHISRASYTARPLPVRVPHGQTAPPPPFDPVNEHIPYNGQPADHAHVRNFLDCVKSRQKPLTGVETGFNSTLPLLLGVLAVRTGKQYAWNGSEATA
jgi:predicted dehydrogenase